MKKVLWKKIAVVISLTLLTCLSAGGCRIGNTEIVFSSELSNNEVFSIDGEVCSLKEARVFLVNYQNLYGTAYGLDLWSHDFGDETLEQYIKDVTISQLAQIVSMQLLAKEQGIALSDEEMDAVKEAAKAYYNSLSKEEIKYIGVNEKDIRELYRQYGLANKLYHQMTVGISEEVSDDDARVMEAYQIFVTNEDSVAAISTGLESGMDFLTLAGTYNEASSTQITFGRGDLASEIEAVAFNLKTNEVSDKIRVENGYYFIKCIDNYNQELTDANKQVILERRRKEAFDDIYDKFIATLPSEFNEELWESIKLEPNSEVTTKSFFETYEEYCNW